MPFACGAAGRIPEPCTPHRGPPGATTSLPTAMESIAGIPWGCPVGAAKGFPAACRVMGESSSPLQRPLPGEAPAMKTGNGSLTLFLCAYMLLRVIRGQRRPIAGESQPSSHVRTSVAAQTSGHDAPGRDSAMVTISLSSGGVSHGVCPAEPAAETGAPQELPLTTDSLRQLLSGPGDGVPLVRFNAEGGFSQN